MVISVVIFVGGMHLKERVPAYSIEEFDSNWQWQVLLRDDSCTKLCLSKEE